MLTCGMPGLCKARGQKGANPKLQNKRDKNKTLRTCPFARLSVETVQTRKTRTLKFAADKILNDSIDQVREWVISDQR
ncbi:hypothetical protein EVAR_72282_1 [Eumeta japonica]|uniref:Uncharacterized protein n=1 Tax=Eumeta variegata TaxID=151549 RepID=A0A4C1T040_EUMVA|nr:hypothetical protein EVAR_72282_1 [Eumeta japonica]